MFIHATILYWSVSIIPKTNLNSFLIHKNFVDTTEKYLLD